MSQKFEIVVANRQRTRRLDRKLIQEITQAVLEDLKVDTAELGLHFISAKEMAKVHEQFMNIAGSTDVITFDHGSQPPGHIYGEIFISVEDAIKQAVEFKTPWQGEMARYIIHGILHLLGHDDLKPADRREMKRAENRLVKKIASRFDLQRVEKR